VKLKDEKLILVESIHITDKFGFKEEDMNNTTPLDEKNYYYTVGSKVQQYCVNGYGE